MVKRFQFALAGLMLLAAAPAQAAAGLAFENGSCPVPDAEIAVKVTGSATKAKLRKAELQWLAENLPGYRVTDDVNAHNGGRRFHLFALTVTPFDGKGVCFDITEVRIRG